MIAPVFLAAVAAAALSDAAPPAQTLTYRFDEVKSSVKKLPQGDESKGQKVAAGDLAVGGDHVKTGMFASVIVSVPAVATRFEIASSSRARLSGDEPGVLLVLEKGRLKAIFDAIAGNPDVERRVATPGALLAVRGTRYGLEVSGAGETTLAVFEGTVEVIPGPAAPPAFKTTFVRAGELATFGPRLEPRPAPMKDRGMNEPAWDRGQSPRGGPGDGRGPGDGHGGDGRDGGAGSGGQRGPGAGGPPGGSPSPGGPPPGGQPPKPRGH